MYRYNKDELKESLSIDQIFSLVAELGGEPKMEKGGTVFVSKTICHNHIGEGSHKLYYYDNTKLFRCYTECDTTFDIYELVQKVKKIDKKEFSLPQTITFVAKFFGIIEKEENAFNENIETLPDWNIINNYQKVDLNDTKKTIEFKTFDKSILKFFPKPHIESWEQDGIKYDVMINRGIRFDPLCAGVVIPHYDIDGNLIGIRERTLIKENEIYGKYRPAIINGKMYNHPLGFNLYNLNYSKNNIAAIKKAIIFEGEKGCLQYASYFGIENDISVACCGSSLLSHQVELLLSLGVEEIIIGFDKQFQEIGDEEWKHWTKKLTNINEKYSSFCQISFLFDKEKLLGYKMSPVDAGPNIFMELFKNRVII